VIVVMGAATALVSSLSTTVVKNARQETTAAALAQAKEALIGYAASDTNRPGELPCPDINNDGIITISGPDADYSGSNCISLIGRLPWRTLGLPDLRDAAGERLWYAVSDPFHANSTAVLNSDTAGTLTVSGNLSASNVIAIVFAPGQNLPGQDRSAANINNSSAYLESVVTAPTSFNLLTPDDQPGGSYTYNDQLTLITHDNLFQVVEKAVGKYFKNSQVTNEYYTTWGALPFASSMDVTNGPVPIAGNAPTPYWSFIENIGDGDNNCSLRPSGCSGNSCIYARCSFSSGSLAAGDVVEITGTVKDVGMGFWRPYDPTTGINKTSNCTQEVCVRVSISGTNWYYPASSIMNNVQVILGPLDSNGMATITFIGTVTSGWIPNRIQFSTSGLPDYSSSTLLPSWFASNNWQDVMYYAVSPGYTPGDGNSCIALPGTPSCLTINGSNGGNDKRAVVVMTGNALSGQTHPSGSIANYLEDENVTPANSIYENKTRTGNFNDQVIIVAP